MCSTNKYGTPIFREMMKYIEEQYTSRFYGYCNGDLLFHSSITSLLEYIQGLIANNSLLERVCFDIKID